MSSELENLQVRPIAEAEVAAFRAAVALGFGQDHTPEDDERFVSLMPLERAVAAFEQGEVVGTVGDFELRLTVPGGNQVAMAGTTMVTVRATHTRRGILRSLMKRHLDDAVERGDPVAGLWASEPGIYGRFGFGLATECHDVKIDTRHLSPPVLDGDMVISLIRAEQIPDLVAPFWSRVASERAGFIDRDTPRWQDIMNDPERSREGATASRHVVAQRDGVVVGYLEYRQKGGWQEFISNGQLAISTLVASDVAAHLRLWSYALDVDLFPNVTFWNGAVDDPLSYELRDSRAIRKVVSDALYVRVLDVTAALEARTYEQDGEIVVAVDDALGYAAGTYKLSIVDGDASVVPTSQSPQVNLGIRELGALYLGRVCVDLYATTGQITGDVASVRRLGQLFATARAPWCPEMF